VAQRKRKRRRERELAGEASYTCGSCGEEIVVPVDASAGAEQSYVEDCPVCCRPHRIRVELDEDGAARIDAEPE
jgi:hypothetical protein